MKIKAIFFDIDNTLMDFVEYKTKCINESIKAMKKAGLDINEKVAFEKLMVIYKESYYESDRIFQDFLNKTLGYIDYKYLAIAINKYREVRYNYVIPYVGTKKTLNELKKKGIKLGIITDAPRVKAWVRLTKLGILDCFDTIITITDTNERKPSKKPFNKALETLKVNPREAMYVGDNPKKDILGAKRAGMRTCLAKYGQFIQDDEKPDFEIKKISELKKIIHL